MGVRDRNYSDGRYFGYRVREWLSLMVTLQALGDGYKAVTFGICSLRQIIRLLDS